MATKTHPRLASRLVATFLVAALSGVVPGALSLVGPAYAAPSNARIVAARKQAAAAGVRLDDLAADLEERTEEYLEIDAELSLTRERIRQSRDDLAAAQSDLSAAEAQLNQRAANIYRRGAVDFVVMLLGVTDFQDLVTRLDLLRRIGRSDAAVVSRVKDAKARIEDAKASLERRRSEQVALKSEASAKRSQVARAYEAQKRYLATINGRVRALIAEERERLERIAREQAAAAARVASVKGGRVFDPAALGAPHPEVVDIARRYVGVTPYVWGGTTPDGFDCSGLTQYCYDEIGIDIPRTSRQQYRFGAFIPPDRLDLLKPGDLLFFGRNADPGRVHHVGIYAGDGQFIHAPQTGMKVSVSSLTGRIADRGDFVGATRP